MFGSPTASTVAVIWVRFSGVSIPMAPPGTEIGFEYTPLRPSGLGTKVSTKLPSGWVAYLTPPAILSPPSGTGTVSPPIFIEPPRTTTVAQVATSRSSTGHDDHPSNVKGVAVDVPDEPSDEFSSAVATPPPVNARAAAIAIVGTTRVLNAFLDIGLLRHGIDAPKHHSRGCVASHIYVLGAKATDQ